MLGIIIIFNIIIRRWENKGFFEIFLEWRQSRNFWRLVRFNPLGHGDVQGLGRYSQGPFFIKKDLTFGPKSSILNKVWGV
jgi:hypothetical protein